MILFGWTVALAATPSLQAVVWAEPFVVERAFTDDMRADTPQVAGGWFVQLQIDGAEVLRAQGVAPLLLSRDHAARAWVGEGGCVLAWVAADEGATLELYFGPAVLPERLSPEAARLAWKQATEDRRVLSAAAQEPVRVLPDGEAVLFRAEALRQRCTKE